MVLRYDSKKLSGAVFLVTAFILSMMSAMLLTVWLVGITVFYIATDKVRGALKALVLIQVRSLLGVSVSVSINAASILKWIVLFALSLYILFSCYSKTVVNLNKLLLLLLIFCVYISFTALFVSSYPIVVIAKVVSYSIPFAAILCGVHYHSDFDWIGYFNKTLGFVLFGGSVLLGSSKGYLVNGHAFQGALNHPNMYGIMLAVFLAGYLYCRKNSIKVLDYFVIIFILFLIFQTESRTGFISAVTVLSVHFLFSKINTAFKVIIVIFGLAFLLISFELPFFDNFTDFIYKGQDDIWYSRSELLDRNLDRFYNNFLFGTGFNVPYIEGFQSFEFSFDKIVENGNFITAILGDIGIVGAFIFVMIYGNILKSGDKRNLALFIVPFMISMGEMVFFSSNNCALVLYFYFAVYFRDSSNSIKQSNNN